MKCKSVLMASALLFSGCSLAPEYHPATVAAPVAYAATGPWQSGEPADQMPRGEWWKIFSDDDLEALELRVLKANPTLAAAVAHYESSEAQLTAVRASQYPAVTAGGSLMANRQSRHRPLRGGAQPDEYRADTVGLGISYDMDLWGRVRNQVEAGTATVQAEAAYLESVRLSLQSQLATQYFRLRGLDAEARLLNETVSLYQKALELTELRHQGGIASGLDVGRAQTQFETARAAVIDVEAQRTLYEHGIAALIGESASSFRVTSSDKELRLPHIPVGVPSTLLQRRPDIAAAERQMAAANANIGVARAAFYPSFEIDASGGYQDTSIAHWLSAPNLFWSAGPSMLITVFDSGRRQAAVDIAKSRYIEATADYRAVVLAAFADVENNLALLKDYAEESDRQQAATVAAERTRTLAMSRYREGVVNYLEVVTAQTAALQAERADIGLQTRRLEASVGLIRALGGGWDVSDLQQP